MNKHLLALIFCLSAFLSNAQTWPREGSKLNYRLIGFSFPAMPHEKSYELEIAKGSHTSLDSFRKHIVRTLTTKENKIIVEVPEFGSAYTWRVVASKGASEFRHFATRYNEHIDTSKLRMTVLEQAPKEFDDHLVSVDGGGVLYDMKGEPVWFIPDTNGFGGNVGDLKFTDDGTMTFISRQAFEINYDGKLLWKTPAKGFANGPEHEDLFHHEFTKLRNGHYMVLAMETFMCKTIVTKDSTYIVTRSDAENKGPDGYLPGTFGCLIEYDQSGNVVWSWRTSNYLLHSDFPYYAPDDSFKRYDAHDNAFYFDESAHVIYVSFRNINRIVKLAYPQGNVINSYGMNFRTGAQDGSKQLFCGQHSITRSQSGDILLFNNNSCDHKSTPSVEILKEDNGKLTKIWEYATVAEGTFKTDFVSGGNAMQLNDSLFFVNMGSKYSKFSIVNRQKKEIWRALPERYLPTEWRWVPNYEFHANLVSRKLIEKAIWRSEAEADNM